ncbi:uncharacterized protein LY89DRAFT_665815 [Mollisia scopiformis]|uniref:Uncharacterized protein n=1 Tax=Mollisia scopiformis TaxID=149040 RepID=A0A194XMJ5_MOLSC|nr:uncharacterized protein LY89DRAFT_665815 [Mollisia scopiformis]KUJ21383.1 hypothetical protein LY89DRAFT_665815 [Mollisia scopiformis]
MSQDEQTLLKVTSSCADNPPSTDDMLDDTPITIPRSQFQLLHLHINELQKDVQEAKEESAHYMKAAKDIPKSKFSIHKKTEKLFQDMDLAKSRAKRHIGKRMSEMDERWFEGKKRNRILTEEIAQLRMMLATTIRKRQHEGRKNTTVKSDVGRDVENDMRSNRKKRKAVEEADTTIQECSTSFKKMKVNETVRGSEEGYMTNEGVEVMPSEGNSEHDVQGMVEEAVEQAFADVLAGCAALKQEVDDCDIIAER